MEKLVGWGEVSGDDDEQVGDTENVMDDWLETTVKAPRSETMRQMEINFMELMSRKVPNMVDAGTPIKKVPKKKALEMAAKGCGSITDWISRSSRHGREWDDDIDLSDLEEIDVIVAREAEKEARSRQAMENMAMELVLEMVASVEASSVASSIVTLIMEEAWKCWEVENTLKKMEDDPEMERMILERIRKREEAKVMVLEAARKAAWARRKKEISQKRETWKGRRREVEAKEMELELEARKVEDAEHGYLDNLMVELVTCPATVEAGDGWDR